MPFIQEQPPINIGADISTRSFEIIKEELKNYPKAKEFNRDEIKVVSRLIHTSTCFKEVLDNIFFNKGVSFLCTASFISEKILFSRLSSMTIDLKISILPISI